ncbi:Ascochitine biosynthesis cluster protein 2 [Pseudocercospora fuligena]|uniref:Ascochitine biosynthesis cluster protein 2 n=1 Tax=Pseudocercospora fuligena TaxID=685502 RepID=A0A8H6RK17_9PEZI|nr:Ascochitine biosynthesis cluster protein 2 [Pseudocercospora fuligena]
MSPSTTGTKTLPDNHLPRPKRYITTHNQDAAATFHELEPELPWEDIVGAKGGLAEDRFSLAYATNQVPVQLSSDKDVETYQQYLEKKPGITIRGGTVLRYVDIAPGNTSPMHRTVSLDYGVVLEGQVEAIMDSGESRLLNRGDIVVQRATNHAWRNASKTEWARMLYVLQEAQPVTLPDGSTLGEDYGSMKGVRASS